MRTDTVSLPRSMVIEYLVMLDARLARLSELPPIYDAQSRIDATREGMAVVERALGITLADLRLLVPGAVGPRPESGHA
jgi:hypothetical protein